jgi:hypothetical protein
VNYKNENMKKIIIIMPLIVLNLGCKKLGICKDEKLSFDKNTNNSNKFRIDGIYVKEGFIFYSNGIFMRVKSHKDNLGAVINVEKLESANNYGLYKVDENDNIELESWVPKSSFGCNNRTMITSGEIINDTIIVLNKISYFHNGKSDGNEIINDTLSFYKLTCKPDSKNDYIK